VGPHGLGRTKLIVNFKFTIGEYLETFEKAKAEVQSMTFFRSLYEVGNDSSPESRVVSLVVKARRVGR